MDKLNALKEAGIKPVKNTKCVDWYRIDEEGTTASHLLNFLSREERVKRMRNAIKKMPFGKCFEWSRKGTGLTIAIEKNWETPKEEFDELCKYLFTPHRRRILNLYIDRKGQDRIVKTVILNKKWEKDPRWHGEIEK